MESSLRQSVDGERRGYLPESAMAAVTAINVTTRWLGYALRELATLRIEYLDTVSQSIY
jgi:hypothetical protein